MDQPGIDVTNKAAVVTGSASGIGRGIAPALAVADAKVVLADVPPDPAEQVAEEIRRTGARPSWFHPVPGGDVALRPSS